MNYNTQNARIGSITEKSLVVGVDVGSDTHWARTFDFRGYEYSKKVFKFSNSQEGFAGFMKWMRETCLAHRKTETVVGMEPTGHYWLDLGMFLDDNGILPVLVNPHHVKKSKELDDNSQTKNDRKDPKVIAGLVKDGRYMIPYMPKGVYAELRTASNLKFRAQKELTSVMNRLARWISIYFPEYSKVYNSNDAKSGLMILKIAPLPQDIVALGVEGVNRIWRDAKLRSVGEKRAKTLVAAAERSIGTNEGLTMARIEIRNLISDYEVYSARIEELMVAAEELLEQVPYAKKLLEIKGIGLRTVMGFVAEVGDIGRFDSPKQIQKLAGLALVENSSGKHKGVSKISKRGRRRLRTVLFEATLALVSKNEEFKELHRYYTTRAENPLKKKQSLVALGCKLIRIFYKILTTGVGYDPVKMLADIVRTDVHMAAA